MICSSCRSVFLSSWPSLRSQSGRTALRAKQHLTQKLQQRRLLSGRRPDHTLRTKLPSQPARTRFAPSPTGYLHLGSLRTALYNYLLARATNGQFSCDSKTQTRIVPDAEERLYEDLQWAGLNWDEGPDRGGPFGPYKQSDRLPIYQSHADLLLQQGKAFRCFCSHEDLERHNQQSLAADGTFGTYPGRCLTVPPAEAEARAAAGEPHTIRFKSSATPPTVHDLVYGTSRKKLPEDHFILVKSDGYPTYHFANVVDDHLMEITHVIRGQEWLISTAKHVSLYEAFGWTPPLFAHVGLLVDVHRQKLSKRNMDIGIDSYRQQGIPPAALDNFAALLGWNPGNDSKINKNNKGVMTLDDMVHGFSLKFTKGDIVVNLEKLDFFRKKHLRRGLENLDDSIKILDEQAATDEYLLEPMRQCIQQREAARTGDLDLEDPLNDLGPPVFPLDDDKTAVYGRLRTMLLMARADIPAAPQDAVEANRLLLWRPATSLIRKTLDGLDDVLETTSIDDKPASATDILDLIRSQLQEIDHEKWNAEAISTALHETVPRVTSRHPGDEKSSPAGYKYLRWALLGLAHGPQMAPLMAFLGREETLHRLEVAKEVLRG